MAPEKIFLHNTASRSTSLLGTLLLLVSANAFSEPVPMTAVDILSLPSVSDPLLNGQGDKVVYEKTEANWNENRRIGNLWELDLQTGISRRLTFDHQAKSGLGWSPSGEYISYIASATDKEIFGSGSHKGIYLMPMTGGAPFQPAIHTADVLDYEWTPDGKAIFFLANEAETEEIQKRRKDKDDMFAFEETKTLRQIWKMSLPGGQIIRVSDGNAHVLGFTLSPDGKWIAYSQADSVSGDSSHSADVWLMDSSGGNSRRLSENAYAEKGIAISPDNRFVLFISDINAEGEYYYDANLFVMSIESGEVKILAEDQTFEVEEAHWSKNSKSIFIQANMGLHSELWEIGLKNGRARQLTDGTHTIKDWSYMPAADRHAFVLETPTNPGEIAAMQGKGGEIVSLTSMFSGLEQQYLLPRQEVVKFTASDGVVLEGLLSYPLGYQPGNRYPLVVDAHGGPRSSEQYGQLGWRTYIPLLAARGFLHFAPNYRGGRGYGDEFMRDMVGGIFNNAHTDILAGVDHLVELGLADPDRLAMRGWSAGGHLTNKLITFTDRFKAASSGAGAVEWMSMYGESDIRFGRTPLFGGSPWQENAPWDVYKEHSPLKDLWKVSTPTIIFAGEKDERVPPTQSIILFRGLRELGVESELYLAPREPHGFKELRHRLFKINVELGWFEKYVNGKEHSWQAAPE